MNVLIISVNQCHSPMPVMPLGACRVAEAAEQAGHKVTFLDLMFHKEPVQSVLAALRQCRPDVIGLSIRNIDNNDMRNPVFFLQEVRQLVDSIRTVTEATIILGGSALAVMPEAILTFVKADLAVVGNGETVFPKLLERIQVGRSLNDVEGIVYCENGAVRKNSRSAGCSDEYTHPDLHHWIDSAAYLMHAATVPVQTKQGCPFKCVYCTYHMIEGNTYQLARPDRVADTVVRLVEQGKRDIEFVDSVFNAPYDHAMALCESLARVRHGARLQSLELNPVHFDDALVIAMERAGFVGMGITVESASDPVLRGLRKGFTSREVYGAAEVVRRHRLPCAWIFLLGGPGETRETVQETLRFAGRSVRKQDVAFFNVGIRIYPGTELESIARRQGVLTCPPEDMLTPVFYSSPEVDADWMIAEIKKTRDAHVNFITSDSLNRSYLPMIQRAGSFLGLRPPLWRHTRYIRRGLKLVGLDG